MVKPHGGGEERKKNRGQWERFTIRTTVSLMIVSSMHYNCHFILSVHTVRIKWLTGTKQDYWKWFTKTQHQLVQVKMSILAQPSFFGSCHPPHHQWSAILIPFTYKAFKSVYFVLINEGHNLTKKPKQNSLTFPSLLRSSLFMSIALLKKKASIHNTN